jgi:hypothetical protein
MAILDYETASFSLMHAYKFLGDDTRHTVQYGREPSSNEGKGVSTHLVMTEEHVF